MGIMVDYDPVFNPGKVQCHVEKEYSGHKTPFSIFSWEGTVLWQRTDPFLTWPFVQTFQLTKSVEVSQTLFSSVGTARTASTNHTSQSVYRSSRVRLQCLTTLGVLVVAESTEGYVIDTSALRCPALPCPQWQPINLRLDGCCFKRLSQIISLTFSTISPS